MEAINDKIEEDRRFSLNNLKIANQDYLNKKTLRKELLAALLIKDITNFSISKGLLLHRDRL